TNPLGSFVSGVFAALDWVTNLGASFMYPVKAVIDAVILDNPEAAARDMVNAYYSNPNIDDKYPPTVFQRVMGSDMMKPYVDKFKSELAQKVLEERQRNGGDPDAPVTDKQLADKAMQTYGWRNVPGAFAQAGQKALESGDKAGALANYGLAFGSGIVSPIAGIGIVNFATKTIKAAGAAAGAARATNTVVNATNTVIGAVGVAQVS